jgi:hypothetical protein
VSPLEALVAIECELAGGDGDAYRRHLRDDALVIVPGQQLTKDETIAAMDASPGWDEFTIEDERVLALGDTAAVLSYRFTGRRGEGIDADAERRAGGEEDDSPRRGRHGFTYSAWMSSAYARTDGGAWRLALHQQTPLGPQG